MKSRIPRRIHQFWAGPPSYPGPPDLLQGFAASWRHHHTRWEYRLWTRADLPRSRFNPDLEEFILGYFEWPQAHAMLPCIHRYEILALHGGVYVDLDWECVRPIDELIAGLECFVALELERTAEKERMVYDGIVGARRGHPAVWEVINTLPSYFLRHWREGWWQSVGPPMLTSVVGQRWDVAKLPRFIFEDVKAPQWHPDLAPYLEDRVHAWHHGDWKQQCGMLPSGGPTGGGSNR